MTSSTIDQAWAALADLPRQAREAAVRERSGELVTAAPTERVEAFVGMLQAEAELSEAAHETLTVTRLRCWLDLPANDIHALAESLAEARQQLPGRVAMRNVTGVQTAIRTLEQEEIQALVAADASFRDALPPELRAAMGVASEAAPPPAEVRAAQAPRSVLRRFWDRLRPSSG